jgi:hypothetical protein
VIVIEVLLCWMMECNCQGDVCLYISRRSALVLHGRRWYEGISNRSDHDRHPTSGDSVKMSPISPDHGHREVEDVGMRIGRPMDHVTRLDDRSLSLFM